MIDSILDYKCLQMPFKLKLTALKKRNIENCIKVTSVKTSTIIGGRFVLAIKNSGNTEKVLKARYVAQESKDTMKSLLVLNKSVAY